MPAKIKTSRSSQSHGHPYRPRGIASKAFQRVYWPYLPLVIVIGLMLVVGGRNSALQQAAANPIPNIQLQDDRMSADELLHDTNVQREEAKVPPLSRNAKLDAAAQAKAIDMVKRNYWSHETPDGATPWIFVKDVAYNYEKLGENLAAGFNDEYSAVIGWMASDSHRQNVLDGDFIEVGFGIAQSSNYTSAGGGQMTVVVAFYGKPSTSARTSVAIVKGATTSMKTSHAQLALAELPAAGVATNVAIGLFILAVLVWLTRHVRSLRRAFKQGEKFVLRHPLFDLGLLVIAAIAYLLSQTAGVIH